MACGDVPALHDWTQADAAVKTVDDELERWDAADSFAFGVEPRVCVEADSS